MVSPRPVNPVDDRARPYQDSRYVPALKHRSIPAFFRSIRPGTGPGLAVWPASHWGWHRP
jgi:hypothetical protein